ncbi:diphthine synthase [Candidatus Woesearchaeota archaeon]|nr:diphthine synthase [Candidatus Woesearchaeota archaeon]
MLTLIGIGLDNEKDITVKGLEAVKQADFVYLENYTSKLNCSVKDLEKFYGKDIILADREIVESRAEEILEKAKTKNVAFLVIGDIFGATTHTDLYLRAVNEKIKDNVIHGTSIINAVGSTGLQLYNFGKAVSLVFAEKGWSPESAYEGIKANKALSLHTLVLLFIDVKENRYMTVNEGIKILLDIEEKRNEKVFTKDTKCIGVARIGSTGQKIKYGNAEQLLKEDFGAPLHSLIIPGKLHFIEEDMLKLFE